MRTQGYENAVQDDTKSRTQHIQRKIIKLVTPYSDEQGRKEGRTGDEWENVKPIES